MSKGGNLEVGSHRMGLLQEQRPKMDMSLVSLRNCWMKEVFHNVEKEIGFIAYHGHWSFDSLESRTGPVWQEKVLLEGNFLNAVSDTLL